MKAEGIADPSLPIAPLIKATARTNYICTETQLLCKVMEVLALAAQCSGRTGQLHFARFKPPSKEPYLANRVQGIILGMHFAVVACY